MKINCNVIKDLLPLYAENIASEESNQLINEHLSVCENCTKELENLKSTEIIVMDTNINSLEKINKSIQRKKLFSMGMAILFTLIIVTLIFAYITTPNYFKFSDDLLTVTENNGQVEISFEEKVTNYTISGLYSSMGYEIVCYDTILDNFLNKNTPKDLILEVNGENPDRIFYQNNYYNDSNDINSESNVVIYGEKLPENSGFVTLPRLSLLSYLTFAAVATAIFIVFAIILFQIKKVFNIILTLAFLPFSYIISTFLVKGTNLTSHHLERDLLFILLISILIFSFLRVLYHKIFSRTKDNF